MDFNEIYLNPEHIPNSQGEKKYFANVSKLREEFYPQIKKDYYEYFEKYNGKSIFQKSSLKSIKLKKHSLINENFDDNLKMANDFFLDFYSDYFCKLFVYFGYGDSELLIPQNIIAHSTLSFDYLSEKPKVIVTPILGSYRKNFKPNAGLLSNNILFNIYFYIFEAIENYINNHYQDIEKIEFVSDDNNELLLECLNEYGFTSAGVDERNCTIFEKNLKKRDDDFGLHLTNK